jgi:hypothetical protein
MTDPVGDGLLREIDEDLRQERYAKLWKRYGNVLVGAAVAIVLAVAANEAWHTYDVQRREAAGERLLRAATAGADGRDNAMAALSELIDSGPAGYPYAAGLRQGALYLRGGDPLAAAGVYERAAGGIDDALYRDVASVLALLAEMGSTSSPADVAVLERRLGALAETGRPLQFTAREMTGYLALRSGDMERARTVFAGLADDALAPPALRARARAMLSRVAGGQPPS